MVKLKNKNVETKYNMKLITLVTKYTRTDILTLNFAHTNNPKWNIMPLWEFILHSRKMLVKANKVSSNLNM